MALLLDPKTGNILIVSGETGGGGGGSLANRAALVPISNGSKTVDVVFSSSWGSADYVPVISFINAVDDTPIMLQGMVTGVTDLGFTVTLNAPVDSGNYQMSYLVLGGS